MEKPIELAIWDGDYPVVSRKLHRNLKGYVEVCIQAFDGRWKRVEGPSEKGFLVFLDSDNEIVGALPLPEPIVEMVTMGTITIVLGAIFREGAPGAGHMPKYGFLSEAQRVTEHLYGEIMRRNSDLKQLEDK